MLLHEARLAIEHEGRRQGIHARKQLSDFRRRHHDGIVDLVFGGKAFDVVGRPFVFGHADDLKLIAVLVLQRDQIGNLSAARAAPGRPEIHQHDFAAPCGGR
jgi:hypothetical protein